MNIRIKLYTSTYTICFCSLSFTSAKLFILSLFHCFDISSWLFVVSTYPAVRPACKSTYHGHVHGRDHADYGELRQHQIYDGGTAGRGFTRPRIGTYLVFVLQQYNRTYQDSLLIVACSTVAGYQRSLHVSSDVSSKCSFVSSEMSKLHVSCT